VDSRASEQVADLVADGVAERIFDEAGDWVAITSPARLRWLAEYRPDIVAKTRGLGLLSDWIIHRLSGATVTEPSCGSSSGMFDLAARTWSTRIVELCGLSPDVLPPVVPCGSLVGTVSRHAADETGLVMGTPVAAGVADTQGGLLGTGTRVGEVTIVGGTFWQNTMVVSRPVIDPQRRLRTLCHVVPGQWMIEGICFYAGLSMRWLRDAICAFEVATARDEGVDPYLVMEKIARVVPASRDGVIAVLSNVMDAKRWVHAAPSFLQFDIADPARSGRGAMVRAVQEAAAFASRAHCDLVSEIVGLPIEIVVFTGGAGKGALWPQIVSDVLGVPVQVPSVTESSALGAAICAGVAIGWYDSLVEPLPNLRDRQRIFEPDPATVAIYEDSYGRWRDVYARMENLTETVGLKPLWRAAGT
jgi:autoinducer 2 (AI-2) kinase